MFCHKCKQYPLGRAWPRAMRSRGCLWSCSIDFHTLFIRNDHWFPHSALCKHVPYACSFKTILLFTEHPMSFHQSCALVPKVNSTILFNSSYLRILNTYIWHCIANILLLLKTCFGCSKTCFGCSKTFSNSTKSWCLGHLKSSYP